MNHGGAVMPVTRHSLNAYDDVFVPVCAAGSTDAVDTMVRKSNMHADGVADDALGYRDISSLAPLRATSSSALASYVPTAMDFRMESAEPELGVAQLGGESNPAQALYTSTHDATLELVAMQEELRQLEANMHDPLIPAEPVLEVVSKFAGDVQLVSNIIESMSGDHDISDESLQSLLARSSSLMVMVTISALQPDLAGGQVRSSVALITRARCDDVIVERDAITSIIKSLMKAEKKQGAIRRSLFNCIFGIADLSLRIPMC